MRVFFRNLLTINDKIKIVKNGEPMAPYKFIISRKIDRNNIDIFSKTCGPREVRKLLKAAAEAADELEIDIKYEGPIRFII